MFSYKFPGKASRVKNLYSQPFRHWPAAVSIFKIHVSGKKKKNSNKPVQSLHSQTWPILDAVLSNMKGLVEEIDLMIDKNCKKEVEENRKRLAPIIDIVILLVRLGLAFRGHRDDFQFHPNVGEYSSGGVGNFVELLNYRVRGGDSVFENHLRTCSKNGSYISETSQNELINCQRCK